MRTVSEMTKENETVWVYFSSREVWERFEDMAEAEGFGFGDLPRKEWAFGYAAAVHRGGKIGHLPLFVWCISFGAGFSECPRRIDFRKFISGEENYDCRESHFKFVMV